MHIVAAPDLYLASQSPRRRDLLTAAGVRYVCCPPGAEYVGLAHEHLSERGAPPQLAQQRAQRKALGASPPALDAPVLAVDTVVDLAGQELGKAADRDAARAMLAQLAGKQHFVHTAHCLRFEGREHVEVVTATVHCRMPTVDELQHYLDSGQWQGKAGAYGIQDDAQQFLSLMDGAFDAVVGLHVEAVRRLLHAMRGAR